MPEERGVIATLIDCFAELPGIGRKSAERLAYHVLRMPREEALAFSDALRAVKENLRPCRICFNLAEGDECGICRDARRDRSTLCVVEQVRDLLALEQTGSYTPVCSGTAMLSCGSCGALAMASLSASIGFPAWRPACSTRSFS